MITIMSGNEAARVVASRSGRKTIEKLHLGCGLEAEINTVRSHSRPPPCPKQQNALLATPSKVPDGATAAYLACSYTALQN